MTERDPLSFCECGNRVINCVCPAPPEPEGVLILLGSEDAVEEFAALNGDTLCTKVVRAPLRHAVRIVDGYWYDPRNGSRSQARAASNRGFPEFQVLPLIPVVASDAITVLPSFFGSTSTAHKVAEHCRSMQVPRYYIERMLMGHEAQERRREAQDRRSRSRHLPEPSLGNFSFDHRQQMLRVAAEQFAQITKPTGTFDWKKVTGA